MIAKITGVLESIESGLALIRVEGGLTYEVLVSGYTGARLGVMIDQKLTLHTLHYLEGQSSGSTSYPRLAGFLTVQDRKFFELFTTCNGVGNKTALAAMSIATEQIAGAIADRDAAMLQSLPKIGRRTAETVIATLYGKVDPYLQSQSSDLPAAAAAGASGPRAGGRSIASEALDVLVSLGENRTQAMTWIEVALREEKNRPTQVQALIERVYQIKTS